MFFRLQLCSIFFLEAGSYEMTNQHVKQNGKLEDNPSSGSPPRTTLLGTIFSPVFNFFSPANKNGECKPLNMIWVLKINGFPRIFKNLFDFSGIVCQHLTFVFSLIKTHGF